MTRQLFEHHPRIGFRYIPGLRARVRHEAGGYLVAANSHGFRSAEFEPQPPTGCRRVLLFGDSFTAGDGVSQGRRFGDLLEKRVPDLEVLNFGLPGTGTDQQYLAYTEYAAAFEHDLLVVAVLVENIRRVAAPYRGFVSRGRVYYYPKPYFTVAEDRLSLHGTPVPARPLQPGELQDAVARSHLAEITKGFGRTNPVPEYEHADGYAWQLLRRILLTWIDKERARQPMPTPVLLVPLPLFTHVEGDADPTNYQHRFAELAAESGCHLHDPLLELMRHPAEQRRRFRFATDVHPTPAGHEALAASLVPAVTRLLPDRPAARDVA